MLKKYTLAVGSLLAVSLVACSGDNVAGGGTVDPNAIAEFSSSDVSDIESSSSEKAVLSSSRGASIPSSSSRESSLSQKQSSSSGEDNRPIRIESSSSTRIVTESSSSSKKMPESSSSGRAVLTSSEACDDCGNGIDPINLSSSSLFDGGIAHANDFFIQCVDDADVRREAFANKSVGENGIFFVLENVQFDIPCDGGRRDEYIDFLNTDTPFVIGHEGDTLFVTPLQSKGIEYACSCVAKASFSLDKNYSGINYTVFGQKETLPVQEN